MNGSSEPADSPSQFYNSRVVGFEMSGLSGSMVFSMRASCRSFESATSVVEHARIRVVRLSGTSNGSCARYRDRLRISVLPHSGHCVRLRNGGASTRFHSSLPESASNPHFRHRDCRDADRVLIPTNTTPKIIVFLPVLGSP